MGRVSVERFLLKVAESRSEAASLAAKLLLKRVKLGQSMSQAEATELMKRLQSVGKKPVRIKGAPRRPAKSTPRGGMAFYGGFSDELRKMT